VTVFTVTVKLTYIICIYIFIIFIIKTITVYNNRLDIINLLLKIIELSISE